MSMQEMPVDNYFDRRWDDPKAIAEHQSSKLELEKRVKALKGELQNWKAKLEDQVATYRSASPFLHDSPIDCPGIVFNDLSEYACSVALFENPVRLPPQELTTLKRELQQEVEVLKTELHELSTSVKGHLGELPRQLAVALIVRVGKGCGSPCRTDRQHARRPVEEQPVRGNAQAAADGQPGGAEPEVARARRLQVVQRKRAASSGEEAACRAGLSPAIHPVLIPLRALQQLPVGSGEDSARLSSRGTDSRLASPSRLGRVSNPRVDSARSERLDAASLQGDQ